MRVRSLMILLCLPLVWTVGRPAAADAQIPNPVKKVKEAAKEESERQIEKKVQEEIENLFRCVWNDLECIRGAEERGEGVALTDEEGNVLTDEEGAPISDPARAEAALAERNAGATVGKIEMLVDGVVHTFRVREGPVDEGYSTGYRRSVRGESWMLEAGLGGRNPETGDEILVTVGIWEEGLRHMCDPFANQVRYTLAGESRSKGLRPGDTASETCPPDPEVANGGVSVNVNVTGAQLDAETGRLHVKGTFAGPMGRGDEALHVSMGRFEATLRPYDELRGSR